MNHREIRNILIDKIIKQFELDSKDVADCVELYYDCQDLRIKHKNRERTEGVATLVSWLAYWLDIGEKVLTDKLRDWVLSEKSSAEAKWAYCQVGIGPIIAAGLAAHIDVEKAKTRSAVWKFAGQAPGFDKRVKGKTLPYNARLKVLCWKMGESFVKVSGKDDAVYGKLYGQFKAEEIKRNEEGKYAQRAKIELMSKKFKPDTVTRKKLEAGLLSDANLHARAKRRAVKIFLSHYWEKGREARGLPISGPYPIDILKHAKLIKAA